MWEETFGTSAGVHLMGSAKYRFHCKFNRFAYCFRFSLNPQEINKDVTDTQEFNVLAFDSASVTDLLQEFSQTSVSRIAIGYILMVNTI